MSPEVVQVASPGLAALRRPRPVPVLTIPSRSVRREIPHEISHQVGAGRGVYPSSRVGASVIAGFRRREPDGVRAFYAEYGRLVYALAYRVLGRADLAEEATQQTFVRAWQAADRLDPERNPAPWLATIAKRVAIDIHRREARRSAAALEDVAVDDPSVVTLPADLATIDAVWHVRRAIEQLPPDEAEIVRLQHLDGLTHTEIAERLAIAVGTVKSRSHRAHGKLAALLGHLREPVS